MLLSKLFLNCYNGVNYQTAGDSVNYAFVEDKDTLYIYFQGSSQISDWVRNFLFKKRPYKDMEIPYKVHSGFLAAWKEVEDIIINKITETTNTVSEGDIDYKWKHIVVVGYSHGGALSGLCYECVWFHRPDLRETGLEGYGFESPRFFGGFTVSQNLKERWAHYAVIRNHIDIVTHCPPWINRYCHVGNILKIGKGIKAGPFKSHYPMIVYGSLLMYEAETLKTK